jgi:hypothetical protein
MLVRRQIFSHQSAQQPAILFLLLAGVFVAQFQSAPDQRLLWPVFAWLSGAAVIIWQPFFMKNLFWFKNALIIGIWLSMISIYWYFSPYLSTFSWRDLITRPSDGFHSELPYQHTNNIPFAFTTPPADSDQCGLASYPCIRNASSAALLRFTINKKGWIIKIVPGENVPEMP